MISWSRVALVILALFAAAAVASCGGEDQQAGRQKQKDPAPERRGGPTTVAEAPEPMDMGETAEVGPFAVTLNSATRESGDGGRHAVVDLTLENRSQEPADASSADYLLRDEEGYSFETGSTPDQRPRPDGPVEPGDKASGQVGFELGDEPADGRLELSVTMPEEPQARAARFEFEAEEEKKGSEPSPEPEPKPEPETAEQKVSPAPSVRPGYSVVEDPSGSLSVEVPSSWSSETGTDSEKQGGEGSFSYYAGEYLTSSITTARSLDAWYGALPGSGQGSGAYLVASEALARQYTDDELIYSLLNDSKATECAEGPARDIDRPPYSGKVQAWFDCNGADNAHYVFAASPEGRACVVAGVAKIAPGAGEADREAVEHIVDSFEVDCGTLPPAAPLESSATASATASPEAENDQPEVTELQEEPPTPPSSEDLDCSDFGTQAEAQAAYEQDTSDPNGLDGPKGEGYTGDPGIACEELPGGPTSSSSPEPSSPGPSSPEPSSPEPSSPEPVSAPPAGGDVDCDDVSQDEAQEIYDQDPSDPNGLDGDGDGEACE